MGQSNARMVGEEKGGKMPVERCDTKDVWRTNLLRDKKGWQRTGILILHYDTTRPYLTTHSVPTRLKPGRNNASRIDLDESSSLSFFFLSFFFFFFFLSSIQYTQIYIFNLPMNTQCHMPLTLSCRIARDQANTLVQEIRRRIDKSKKVGDQCTLKMATATPSFHSNLAF